MENFEEHIRHITSKKGRKQGKSCVEFTAEMSSKNASARTDSPDSVMTIFQSKTLIAPRPSKIDDDEMKVLQANKHSTVREFAIALKVSVGSVHGHLKSLGFIKKLDVWLPHELKEIHLMNRMSVCDQLIKCEENDPFLKRMFTTKNELFTTMSAEKEVGIGEVKY